jgi:hypothetical protein
MVRPQIGFLMFYRAVVTTDSGDVVVATWTGDDVIRLYSGADDEGIAKEVISLADSVSGEFNPPCCAQEMTHLVVDFMKKYDPTVKFDSVVAEVLLNGDEVGAGSYM